MSVRFQQPDFRLRARLAAKSSIVFCAAIAAVSPSASATQTNQLARTSKPGKVTIRFAEVPRRARANATLRGPAGKSKLSHTRTIKKAAAGTYSLTAKPISKGANTYYPVISACAELTTCGELKNGKAQLTAGGQLTLWVTYKNVVNKRTEVLSRADMKRISGGLGADGILKFKGRRALSFGKGAILIHAPTKSLPFGILRKVKSVAKAAAGYTVTTSQADFSDAVPSGFANFSTSATKSTGARAAQDLPDPDNTMISYEFAGIPVSCGGLGDARSDRSLNLTRNRIEVSYEWGGPGAGIVVLGNLAGKYTSSFTSSSGFSCTASTEYPSGANPGMVVGPIGFSIGPVPIWMELEFVATGSVTGGFEHGVDFSSTDAFTFDATVSYLRKKFDGSVHTTHANLANHGTAAGLNSGKLGIASGLKTYLDFGSVRLLTCILYRDCSKAPSTSYLEFSAGPTLRVPTNPVDPWWRLDVDTNLTAGFSLKPLRLSASREYSVKKYPIIAPPGKPTGLAASPADGGAHISWTAPLPKPISPDHEEEDERCACLNVTGYTVFVDGQEWETVTGTGLDLTGLVNGQEYTVTVQSNSAFGGWFNSTQTEAVKVTPEEDPGNGAPPIATISGHPPNPGSTTSATFSFSANQAGSTFLCSLDSLAPATCTSPAAYGPLSLGTHQFRVWAVNALGDESTSPATYTWLVNTVGP